MESKARALESWRAKAASSGFSEILMVTAFTGFRAIRWQGMSRPANVGCVDCRCGKGMNFWGKEGWFFGQDWQD
jgi:hypothetical protein